MKKETILLIVIGAFVLFALQLKINQARQNAVPSSAVETMKEPAVLPVLAQNQVQPNPFVKQRLSEENIPRQDTKDFKEVSPEKSNADKPYGSQM